MTDAGVQHAEQFTASPEQKAAYLAVRGCGQVTWSYFAMLLGKPDVKPDTWILRYVRTAVGHKVTPQQARDLLTGAAEARGDDTTRLDHAVWSYARSHTS